jgi:non-canonical (house-cleaning) NTP pyrophosphatase
MQHRRLARDYEALPQRSRTMIHWAMANIVVVVSAVGEEHVGPSARSADNPGHCRDLVQQGQELGDVVAVSAGQ